MAMTAAKLAYFREYRKNHKQETAAAFKKWHEARGKDRYYGNVALTRAIKRKSYYTSRGNLEKAQAEQDKIDAIRLSNPAMPAGRKLYPKKERVIRRKAVVRKARYRHVTGLPDLMQEPEKCEVCGRGGKMCLDHCHKKNTFRGWLCDDCNIAIGRLQESIPVLEAMIAYLKKGETAGSDQVIKVTSELLSVT